MRGKSSRELPRLTIADLREVEHRVAKLTAARGWRLATLDEGIDHRAAEVISEPPQIIPGL